MTLTWTREDSPRWDADKQRLFGPAGLAAVGLAPPAAGDPVANEWWRVTDGDDVAGYGWLDCEWGDARITFFVAPGRRGRGVGRFILDHLEAEAAARGLNYIYNVVPETHPDGPWIRNWLSLHGFREAGPLPGRRMHLSLGRQRYGIVTPAGGARPVPAREPRSVRPKNTPLADHQPTSGRVAVRREVNQVADAPVS